MMRDANSHHSDDPAHRWSALLAGLIGRRRDAVVKALRNSVDSGYPANAEGVRVLVAYAQGQISARQYVAQVLESLGFIPAAYVPAQVSPAPESWHSARDADPWRAPARTQDPWRDELSANMPPREPGRADQRVERRAVPRPPQTSPAGLLEFGDSRRAFAHDPDDAHGTTVTQPAQTSRQQAVQAYMSGQIPIEEFLRLNNG